MRHADRSGHTILTDLQPREQAQHCGEDTIWPVCLCMSADGPLQDTDDATASTSVHDWAGQH